MPQSQGQFIISGVVGVLLIWYNVYLALSNDIAFAPSKNMFKNNSKALAAFFYWGDKAIHKFQAIRIRRQYVSS